MQDPAVGERPHGLNYRPEIDGLRAIAVVAVILNHAGFGWIPGGFLGVDLFFVISGYLITGILAADLAAGDFAFGRFYERRVRRILPALLLVTLLCIPPAVLLMVPDELKSFGQSLVATTLFANNILLWQTTGYFAMPVALKPLMHSWSLGVEEQYYLLAPLLVLLAWRLGGRRGLWTAIALATTASFALCLWQWPRDPDGAYFLLFSRGWELGVGSLAALAGSWPRLRLARLAPVLAMLGLAMALLPLFIFNENMPVPSWPVLLPVIGIALALLFAHAGDPATRLLTLPPLTWIGLVSYSAYLIHQPVFAFTRIMSLEQPSSALLALLIPPILLCAWLSWRFVEQPFRDRRRIATRTMLAICGAAALVAVATGAAFHFTSGLLYRWPELVEDGGSARGATIAYNMAAEVFRKNPLPETPDGRTRVLVIGDSFARDFINMGLESGGLDPSHHIINLTHTNICKPERRGRGFTKLVKRADFVVVADRLRDEVLPCVTNTIAWLRGNSSAKIIIIGRKSFGWNNNAVMLLDPSIRYAWRTRPTDDAVAVNEQAKRLFPPELFVDALGPISDREGRVPIFTPDHKFISYDREHLTRAGAAWLGGILFRNPALRALHEGVQPTPRTTPPTAS